MRTEKSWGRSATSWMKAAEEYGWCSSSKEMRQIWFLQWMQEMVTTHKLDNKSKHTKNNNKYNNYLRKRQSRQAFSMIPSQMESHIYQLSQGQTGGENKCQGRNIKIIAEKQKKVTRSDQVIGLNCDTLNCFIQQISDGIISYRLHYFYYPVQTCFR